MDRIQIMVQGGNDAGLAGMVEKGIPVRALIAFARSAGFESEDIAKFMLVHPRTYARRRVAKARLNIPEGDRALRLMRLYHHAKRVLGTREDARSWLHQPLRVLGGRMPLDFARTEPGAREVQAVLSRFEHGILS